MQIFYINGVCQLFLRSVHTSQKFLDLNKKGSVLASNLESFMSQSHALLTVQLPLENHFLFKLSTEWNILAFLACIPFAPVLRITASPLLNMVLTNCLFLWLAAISRPTSPTSSALGSATFSSHQRTEQHNLTSTSCSCSSHPRTSSASTSSGDGVVTHTRTRSFNSESWAGEDKDSHNANRCNYSSSSAASSPSRSNHLYSNASSEESLASTASNSSSHPQIQSARRQTHNSRTRNQSNFFNVLDFAN